jgi:hypothetical protein
VSIVSTRPVSTVSKPPTPPVELAIDLGQDSEKFERSRCCPASYARVALRRGGPYVLFWEWLSIFPKIVRANFRVAESPGNRQRGAKERITQGQRRSSQPHWLPVTRRAPERDQLKG